MADLRSGNRKVAAGADRTAVDVLADLVRALRAVQALHGDRPWLGLDLTMVQLKAVMLLVHAGGLRSRALADALGIGPSAVTPLADRLVEQGMARRHPDAHDRRIVWIRPTARAIAVNDRLLRIKRSVLAELLRRVPRAERAAVTRSVRLLLQAAEQLLAAG